MTRGRLAVLLVLAAAVAAFFAFDLDRHLTLDAIRTAHAALAQRHAQAPGAVIGLFFVVYVVAAAVSLPGAALLTLLAGAIFGVVVGTVVVSFASSIGATLAFLASRFVLQETVRRIAGRRFDPIDRGIEREGAFYLFALRLIPLVPFWLVNLAMGLTRLRAWTFYWVSQVGMLAATIVYVNLGTRLASLESAGDLLSPALVGAFVAIGLLPLAARRAIALVRARRVYARWRRPARFDRNLVVIGAGSAGLVSAYVGATVNARVTLVERDRMGGECLHTGCVPSKALIRSARLAHRMRRAERYGLASVDPAIDFGRVMDRIADVVRAIEPHDSTERYRALGVDVVRGDARIVTPWEVDVALRDENGRPTGETRRLSTRQIVIAAGAAPTIPELPGLGRVEVLTSENLWSLRTLPRRLLVLGGGPIGCELAQAFARLGSSVTVVHSGPRLLMREDPDVGSTIERVFVDEGIALLLDHEALRVKPGAGGDHVLVARRRSDDALATCAFDRILVAVGRRARVDGYGLEELGVRLDERSTLDVNEFLETNFPNIHACGDVAGPYQFTHTASHMAWYASVNALFGQLRRFRVDWSIVPWVTFTEPEVARVGLNETDAAAQGIDVETTRYALAELDRAITDGATEGFVKLLTRAGSDRIVGATIVGENAGEMLAEIVAAMKHGVGLNTILRTIHVYPTWSEANRAAAGQWKRARAPKRLLEWLRRYHDWQLR